MRTLPSAPSETSLHLRKRDPLHEVFADGWAGPILVVVIVVVPPLLFLVVLRGGRRGEETAPAHWRVQPLSLADVLRSASGPTVCRQKLWCLESRAGHALGRSGSSPDGHRPLVGGSGARVRSHEHYSA